MADDETDDTDTGASTSYAQIVVPGFTLTAPVKNDGDVDFTTAQTGNSFIRLGASPLAVAYSSETGLFSVTTDATVPVGFTTSYDLAKIVGNMDSGSDGATSTVASAEATTDTALDAGEYTSDPFQGSSLLGFADDTRVRDDEESGILYVNGAVQTNSPENRRTETYRLLSKGGWWDHSDGNRISTTVGDKVEVIQGNYKLVVLGRRASSDTSDKKTVDISGGYEFSKKYEYLSTAEVWASWEKSSEIHATKVTSGIEASYFKGSLRRTYIGRHPDESEEEPEIVNRTWAASSDSETRATGSVKAKTWAKAVETYVGSVGDPVEHVLALTFVDYMEDVRIGTTMQDTRFFSAEHLTVRSAGALWAFNVGVVNTTTFNATPLLWKIDIAPFQFETKIGVDFRFATQRIRVQPAKVDLTVKREDLAAAVTELRAYSAVVAASAVHVGASNTQVCNNVSVLASVSTQVAAMHNLM